MSESALKMSEIERDRDTAITFPLPGQGAEGGWGGGNFMNETFKFAYVHENTRVMNEQSTRATRAGNNVASLVWIFWMRFTDFSGRRFRDCKVWLFWKCSDLNFGGGVVNFIVSIESMVVLWWFGMMVLGFLSNDVLIICWEFRKNYC